MTIDSITSALRAFIRERFNVPEGDHDFTDDIDLFNYGYVDSFGAIELTNFVEKQFSITVSSSDWVSHPMNTVREISNFVLKRQSGEL